MFKHLVKIIAVSAIATPCFATSIQPAVGLANEIGVSPESLVLSDIATSQCGSASAILNRIDQATGLTAAVTAARTAVDEAGQLVTALATQIQTAADDELTVAAYHQAVTDLETARAAYFAARQALRDEALDGIDIAKVQRLIAWQSVAIRNVPAAFRVLELTDAQWDTVERALRAERRAARLGETLDHDYAQLLANVRSDVDVVDAQYQLAANLNAVELIFSQFTGE